MEQARHRIESTSRSYTTNGSLHKLTFAREVRIQGSEMKEADGLDGTAALYPVPTLGAIAEATPQCMDCVTVRSAAISCLVARKVYSFSLEFMSHEAGVHPCPLVSEASVSQHSPS